MMDSQGISSNPFSTLQNINPAILSKLALDSGISLGETKEEVDATIDLIKAKELAPQSTLAEAEKNKEVTDVPADSLEVEDIEDNTNEEHMSLIRDLEEVTEDSEVIKDLEVERVRQKGKTKIHPNECLILEHQGIGQ